MSASLAKSPRFRSGPGGMIGEKAADLIKDNRRGVTGDALAAIARD